MFKLTQNSDQALPQGNEQKTILIVDDEPVIRDLCMRALRDYRVLEAANGEEALKVFERGGGGRDPHRRNDAETGRA